MIRLLAAVLCVLLAVPMAPAAVFAAPKRPKKKKKVYKAKASGEIQRFERKKPKKTKAKKDKKAAPKVVSKRRTRAKSNIDDIDDEIDILRELLDIERGSPTEADTLLELSYVLWDRAEAYEQEAYDEYYTLGIHEAKERKDRKEAHSLRIEQQNLLEQARSTKNEVIDNLKRIERRFSRFAKLDEVLYALGYHLNEMERHGEAVDAFFRLVRKTPKSAFIPDAYLGIGNYYFGKNQGGQALTWYTKVLKFKRSNVYGWALYYIGWVAYNQQAYKRAVNGFVRVLDYSMNEARGRITFFEDGRKYLVKSWAEYGKPAEAITFFKKVVPGQEIELMDALARHYIDTAEYAKSNTILADLIKETDDRKRGVEYYYLRVDNFYKLSDLDNLAVAVKDLARALRRHGRDGAKNVDIPLLLAEIASTFHAEAERTLEKQRLVTAEGVYGTYIDHFSDHKHAYDMLHNHALALFQLERWKEAAQRYEKVIVMQPKGKYAEPSAHRAMISYLKLYDPNAETQEHDKDKLLLKQKLNEDNQRIVNACERYITIAEKQDKTEDVAEARFLMARTYYQHNHFETAARHFEDFVRKHTDHKLILDGAKLMMSSYYLGQDGKKLNYWADELLEGRAYKKILTLDEQMNKGELSKTLVEIKENKEYNLCLTHKDQPVVAAKCLLKYAADYPTASQALRAYAGAARFYRNARMRDKVIGTYEKLAKDHPEDARAVQALLEIADVHRETANFSLAAAAYESLVEKYPKSEEAIKALSRANQIREALGQRDKVIANAKRFLKYFPKDADAVNQAYKLTVQYVEKKRWNDAIWVSKKFLGKKRAKALPIQFKLAAMANMAFVYTHMRGGDRYARQYTDQVITTADAMVKDGTWKDVPQIGKDAVALAYFVRGEMEFNKMLRIKVKARKLADAVKLATKKSTAAAVADKSFVVVMASKNPKWTAAAASRRGRSQHAIGDAIAKLPPPKAFRRVEDLRYEWEAKMTEKAEPFYGKAKKLYKEALDKAAEVFAFDKYWEDARDNLKKLDQDFEKIVEIPEYTTPMSTIGWSYKGSPKKAIPTIRADLFNRPLEDTSDVAVKPGGEKAKAPQYDHGAAYTKLAMAHHIQGQHHDALMVAAVGMTLVPKMKENAHLLTMMGLSEIEIGNTQRGLVRFAQAAKADDKTTTPLLNTATIQLKKLDLAAAAKLLREVIKRDPNHYWARVTLPVALRRLGKGEEALGILDKLVQEQGDRPEGHFNRCVTAQAVLGATQKRAPLTRALKACEEAIEHFKKGTAKHRELSKRATGIRNSIEFLEPEPAPGAAKPAAEGGAAAAPAEGDAKPAEGGDAAK